MFPAEAEKKYKEILNSLTAEQRVRIVFELYDLGKELVRAGIRDTHPTWDEQQIEMEVRERINHETRRNSSLHSRTT